MAVGSRPPSRHPEAKHPQHPLIVSQAVSHDGISDYFHLIGKYEVLTKSEETRLCRQIEIGLLASEQLGIDSRRSDDELLALAAIGDHCYRRLLASNLRLVVAVAKKKLGRGVAFADLIQDGNLGLIRAAQGFDHSKGFRFSTYAVPWIKEYIEQGITKQANVIKIPHYQLGRLGTLKKIYGELVVATGREPSLDEVAEQASLRSDDVQSLLRLETPVASLHQLVGDDIELGDLLPDPSGNDPIEHSIYREEISALRGAVSSLDHIERQVVGWRYGFSGEREHDLREVARKLKMSDSDVSEVLSSSMAKLSAHPLLVAAVT